MEAQELRIGNIVGCKVSNDSGIYYVEGIDGWKRIFKSEADEKKYHKNKLSLSGKSIEFHDERLVRLAGGARNGELYIESKLRGIKLTEEWLLRFAFEDVKKHGHADYSFLMEDGLFIHIHLPKYEVTIGQLNHFSHSLLELKYVHQLQNLY